MDTLEFKLDIKCTWKNKDNKEMKNVDAMYKNHNVYSEHIKWVPKGKQAALHSESDVGPSDDKILISKMRPVRPRAIACHLNTKKFFILGS